MHRRVFVGLTALALLVSAGLQAGADPDGKVEVRITPIEGEATTGVLRGLTAERATLEQDGKETPVALADVTTLAFVGTAEAGGLPKGMLRVTLTGGEELLGRLVGANEEALQVQWADDVAPIRLPFEVVRHVESLDAQAQGSRACVRPALRYTGDASDDVVWLRDSGDRIAGTLVTSTKDALTMEDARERSIEVAWDNVLVVHLVNDAVEAPAVALQTRLEDRRGSRLWLAAPAVLQDDALVFALRSAPKQTLRLPVDQVRTLEFSGPRFVYASDLPFEGTYEPYHKAPEGAEWVDAMQKARWQPRRHLRSDDGCPLRLGKRVYRHGFYAHSKSRITIPLDGAYTSFRTTFGVLTDDPRGAERNRRPELANVDARILADDKELWSRKGITLADGPVAIGPLDLAGAKTLVLEVDYGKNLDVCDDVAWVDPILVRK